MSRRTSSRTSRPHFLRRTSNRTSHLAHRRRAVGRFRRAGCVQPVAEAEADRPPFFESPSFGEVSQRAPHSAWRRICRRLSSVDAEPAYVSPFEPDLEVRAHPSRTWSRISRRSSGRPSSSRTWSRTSRPPSSPPRVRDLRVESRGRSSPPSSRRRPSRSAQWWRQSRRSSCQRDRDDGQTRGC